ncbi:hypothetical protein [Cyclobacterium qasimii]|uniref:Uncharacterized protein n=2 Tax=Cyclobacterium qasimii TaxID=1350429 RepID=S7X6U7_9BACT|nr:hypothetical protein [Cyclobacterium qasimii]EPR71768.1 hypothetical protein ADICYQ_0016 [Cyclobacterium qasimii M12-11B]GEO22180.1 hypothetical protein CQA01_27140 [Cyclobacterium qasimii]
MVDYDGKEYLVFEVASLKEPDQYGKTHTAYISKKVDVPKTGKTRKFKSKEKALLGFLFGFLSLSVDGQFCSKKIFIKMKK